METEFIKNLILSQLPGSIVEVTGDGHHFEAKIISHAFKGLSKIKQHQMIYHILNDYIKSGELHAISLNTSDK